MYFKQGLFSSLVIGLSSPFGKRLLGVQIVIYCSFLVSLRIDGTESQVNAFNQSYF